MPKGLPKRTRLGVTVSLKMTREQKKTVENAAEAAGMRFGTWARMILLANAGKSGEATRIAINGSRFSAPEFPKRSS